MNSISLNLKSNQRLNLLFHALADVTRRSIISRLSLGKLNAGEIAKKYKISLPAISKHLKVLERAGLIEREKNGREHIFCLNNKSLADAVTWVRFHEKLWTANLDSLDKYLKNS